MRYFYVILAIGLAQNIYAQSPYVSGNTTICPGEELTLFAGGDSIYAWAISSNPQNILSTLNWVTVYPEMDDTVILYTANDTLYTPVLTNPYQCDYHCFVPNRFTPDGDLYNETFCPILSGKETLGCRLTIVNRSGQIVFDETELYPPCWNGRRSNTGHILEDDVYLWFFSYIREDNTTAHLDGFVILAK